MVQYRTPSRVVALAMALAMVALGASAARGAGLAALVTDLKGSVAIQSGGRWHPATLLASLAVGAQVRAAAGAHATLSFVRGGTRVQLAGPCTVRILAGGARLLRGSKRSLTTVTPPGRAAVALASNVNIARMGGVQQRRLDRAPLEITSDDRVADLHPRITWRSTQTFGSYKLRVSEADEPYREVAHLALPASATRAELQKLQYGKRYDVNLTGSGEAVEHAWQTIEVLPWKQAEQLVRDSGEAERQFRAHPSDVTPLVLLMARYQEAGLYAPALAVARRVVRLRPNDRGLYRVVGRLYDLCHDHRRADEMYRKAAGKSG